VSKPQTSDSDRVAVVFTAKSVGRILKEGGSSSWRLDRNHARRCTYAICTRNANADWVEGPEAHCFGFLLGRVKDVIPAPDYEGRYLIQFSEFALIDIPDAWKGDRNPVRYGRLQDFGIDPSTLEWNDMPVQSAGALGTTENPHKRSDHTGLTIAQAKAALAVTFGVPAEAIEITIRG
jgi:hypothetical protein